MAAITRAPRFDDFLGRSSDAAFVVGPGFRIAWWGPRAEQVLGVPAAHVVGRRCFDVFAGSGAIGRGLCGPKCWVAQAVRADQPVPAFCINLRTPVGEQREFTPGFLVDPSGKFLVHLLRERETAESLTVAEPTVAALPGQSAGSPEVARLTRRQRQVLQFVMSGASSLEIARTLCVTHATARNHVQNVLVKLGVRSRLEAALLAERAGMSTPAGGRRVGDRGSQSPH